MDRHVPYVINQCLASCVYGVLDSNMENEDFDDFDVAAATYITQTAGSGVDVESILAFETPSDDAVHSIGGMDVIGSLLWELTP